MPQIPVRIEAPDAVREPLAARAWLIPLLPQRSEERPNVVGERRRLFHRGEVAAARHDRPTAYVSVGTFGQRPWYAQHFTRELAVASRHGDRATFRDRPWPVHAEVIRKER